MCTDEKTLYYLTNRVTELENKLNIARARIDELETELARCKATNEQSPDPQADLYKKGQKWGR